ncbi:hypothetical protein FB567DRAFT_63341 [Paraphoma chrysanthemicola]|uniref:Secreted protein n=1 Tax=Paraphoma chrysanthemicola TaxID=798071 RepID=A0A8K0R5Y7_9PLEO|nr:hypothetical protein FB567DRAFT_63341 [Paraphoma chrysanthemicola]
MKYTYAALALAAGAAATPASEIVTRDPTPSSFKITNVVYGGSGCPQGSIDIKWNDSRVFPINFSKEFTAKVGTKAEVADSRKNCQINIKLDFEPGFSFAIFSADYTGWADLDTGVTGTIKSTYYFSGETEQSSAVSTLAGPIKAKYYKQDKVPVVQWSPCGSEALFNVNSEIALTPFATPANGVLAATRESGKFVNNLYFAWKKC